MRACRRRARRQLAIDRQWPAARVRSSRRRERRKRARARPLRATRAAHERASPVILPCRLLQQEGAAPVDEAGIPPLKAETTEIRKGGDVPPESGSYSQGKNALIRTGGGGARLGVGEHGPHLLD